MKKEIIIFKDQKPTKEEICHSIEHFLYGSQYRLHLCYQTRSYPI